jgi:chromosomal replication initiation ATPase DnaA
MDESDELLKVLESPRWPPFYGGKQFVKWVKKIFIKDRREREIPDSVYLTPNRSRIKAEVCETFQTQESDLLKTRRGVRNEPRDVAIYLIRMLRQEGLRDIGKEFGLGSYSSVSSAIDRVKSQMAKDHRFRLRVKEIMQNIKKSQTKT